MERDSQCPAASRAVCGLPHFSAYAECLLQALQAMINISLTHFEHLWRQRNFPFSDIARKRSFS